MSGIADALRDPIALQPNRVPRFYRGGRLLDAFRGVPARADDDRPEDWLGSATRAWMPPGSQPSPLGLSEIDIDGQPTTVEELLRREPEALAGRALIERAGPTLGLLVKLLDAAQRLPVHCHPSREHAARLLGSRFGKTEAWLILGTRETEAQVWAGFGEPIDRDRLRGWIERQATDELLAALVEYRVATGDVLFIPAGTPHAIGTGVFLLELQEPTDLSVVAETRNFPIDRGDASLGLGWERAIDFFETRPGPDLRQQPSFESPGVTRLLGHAADPFFRALRMRVGDETRPPFEPTYALGVVVGGRGALHGASRRLELRPGVTFALPAAAVATARLVPEEEVELVWCLGPDPAALDRQPLPSLSAR